MYIEDKASENRVWKNTDKKSRQTLWIFLNLLQVANYPRNSAS